VGRFFSLNWIDAHSIVHEVCVRGTEIDGREFFLRLDAWWIEIDPAIKDVKKKEFTIHSWISNKPSRTYAVRRKNTCAVGARHSVHHERWGDFSKLWSLCQVLKYEREKRDCGNRRPSHFHGSLTSAVRQTTGPGTTRESRFFHEILSERPETKYETKTRRILKKTRRDSSLNSAANATY